MRIQRSMGDIANARSAAYLLAATAFLPAIAFGQSAIEGIVKDSSGAVMAGVTVEASSPALIERSKTVATNGQGRYEIIDLRPGAYTLTFTMPGFSTQK